MKALKRFVLAVIYADAIAVILLCYAVREQIFSLNEVKVPTCLSLAVMILACVMAGVFYGLEDKEEETNDDNQDQNKNS